MSVPEISPPAAATAPDGALHVGYVVKRYPRYSETFIVNEILAHEASGMGVTIFALRPSSDTHFQDSIARVRAPVHYLPAGEKFADLWSALGRAGLPGDRLWPALSQALDEDAATVYQAVELARQARALGLDLLHAHFATGAAAVARLAADMLGIPLTLTAHAKDIFHDSVEQAQLARKLDAAAAVITVSDFNACHLQAAFRASAAKVRRIYNGIDLERFGFADTAVRPPLVVGVGRLVEKKGFASLVAACAVLRDRGLPVACELIGDGPERDALAAQARSLGLAGQVTFLGPRPQAEVIDRVRRAAVFAAPCVVGTDGNRDGLPTVLLEAMALGTPCVSTDVTGIPEVVRHEVTGLQVPQNDPVALADAIARLVAEPQLGRHLARAARRLIEDEFDIRVTTRVQRALFESLCVPLH